MPQLSATQHRGADRIEAQDGRGGESTSMPTLLSPLSPRCAGAGAGATRRGQASGPPHCPPPAPAEAALWFLRWCAAVELRERT